MTTRGCVENDWEMILLNWARPLFIYFRLFKRTLQFLQQFTVPRFELTTFGT